MRKNAVSLFIALIIIFTAVQFVPVKRTNPPAEEEIPAPAEIKEILKRACYDCHSNETNWPWYSRIAPASWLVARDVSEGRKALNFSTWNRLSAGQQAEILKESWEEVEENEMPPWLYRLPHRDARLSKKDKKLLRTWTLGQL